MASWANDHQTSGDVSSILGEYQERAMRYMLDELGRQEDDEPDEISDETPPLAALVLPENSIHRQAWRPSPRD